MATINYARSEAPPSPPSQSNASIAISEQDLQQPSSSNGINESLPRSTTGEISPPNSPGSPRKRSKNPFLNSTREFTIYEKVKTVLMAPIAALRLLMIIFVVLLGWIWTYFITIGYSPNPDPELLDLLPMGHCRRLLLAPVRWLARALLWLFGYLWIHEHGCCHCFNPCASRTYPAPVIVCNHVTFVEAVWLVVKFLPCVAGNITSATVPIFRALTPIVVDRESGEGRGAAARMIKQRTLSGIPWSEAEEEALVAAEAAAETEQEKFKVKVKRAAAQARPMKPPYPPLLIFPEGTTTADSFLLQFKAGAFLSGQPVQPVVVKYPYCHYEVVWSCDTPVLTMVWRMLSQVYNCMTVTYLPVYIPSDAEKADPQLYADNVRKVMCEAMQPGTEMTNHTYEDARLLAAAQEAYHSVNPDITTDITYNEVHKWLNLSVEDTKKLIETFREVDANGDGFISREEFTTWLNLDPTSTITETYFGLMDHDNTGCIDFRSFVQALVLSSNSVGKVEKVQVLFWMYDADQSGDISRQEVMAVLDASKLHRTTGHAEHEVPSRILADKVMAGREVLDFDDFERAVSEHPELMDCAMPMSSSEAERFKNGGSGQLSSEFL